MYRAPALACTAGSGLRSGRYCCRVPELGFSWNRPKAPEDGLTAVGFHPDSLPMIHLASSHCCPLHPWRLKTSCTLATTSPRTPVRSTPSDPPPHASLALIKSHRQGPASHRTPPGTGRHG